MAENSKIEWTHHTANLWWGCTKVHSGCDHCYAETLSKRWDFKVWGNDNPRREINSVWKDLHRFQKLAAAKGEIHRVFVGSMMDIFEKSMPLQKPTMVGKVIAHETGMIRSYFFEEIIPNSPNLLFLLLTKRPSNINKYIPESWKANPPKNVLFGTSPANQETADILIPQLLQVNGGKFLSCEPLLGAIDMSKYLCEHFIKETGPETNVFFCDKCGAHDNDKNLYLEYIDWIIVGGESGHNARPMHRKWVQDIRRQCENAAVPFFFKQWGEWVTPGQFDYDGRDCKESVVRIAPRGDNSFDLREDLPVFKVGKKAAGHLLDGKEHFNFPNI